MSELLTTKLVVPLICFEECVSRFREKRKKCVDMGWMFYICHSCTSVPSIIITDICLLAWGDLICLWSTPCPQDTQMVLSLKWHKSNKCVFLKWESKIWSTSSQAEGNRLSYFLWWILTKNVKTTRNYCEVFCDKQSIESIQN